MKKMIILDGNSIMFRAYYATAYTGNLMQARSGLYTNAIYGFVNMIQHILSTPDMTNIFVAFDKGKKTLRHTEYDAYKGGRKPTPKEFLMQIPYIKEYLDVLGIKHLELDDYEADDIVGSMAIKAAPLFDEIMVISGDRDLLQLAKGNIHVYLTKKGLTDLECYTEENFFEKLGIESSQMTDYKGLIGDSSDNLPGVTSVGPKTACKLLKEYGTLEGIIASVDQIKGKVGEAIKMDADVALRSKHLATLYLNVDLGIEIADTSYVEPKTEELLHFYEKVEFASFIKKLQLTSKKLDETSNNSVLNLDSHLSYYYNELELVKHDLGNAEIVLIEAELTGENYHQESLLGIALVIGDHGHFIDCSHLLMIKDLLENEKIKYYAYDIKKLYVALTYVGIKLKTFGFDAVLATYVINPSLPMKEAKSLYENFFPTKLAYLEEIYGKKTKYQIPELEVYGKYAIDKAALLIQLKAEVDEQLKVNQQLDLLYQMEIPLAIVLGNMELAGFRVSRDRLLEIGDNFLNEIKRLEWEIHQLAGHPFNIGSPKQLGEVLFDELAIGKTKKNKTGYSTSAEVLEKLINEHPIVEKVLDYRKYSKLHSTYIVGLNSCINEKTKNVHTIFKQALTLTGRLSSVEPNIQNIPIRTSEGRLIRSAFTSRFDDGILVSADYSQIELRILAAMANCKNMIDAFNSGEDLHRSTASKIYGIPSSEVDSDKRRIAKAVNFGIVYGMSAWGLAEELHISPNLAQTFINRYFEIYPEIKGYLDEVVENAKANGYTTTLFHRKRFMPEINSSNGALREFAKRTAKNAPIQGTAADVIKLAMIKVASRMESLELKSRLIAQVHDELVVDTIKEEEEIVKTILQEEMENIVTLSVKLAASIASGHTWDLK